MNYGKILDIDYTKRLLNEDLSLTEVMELDKKQKTEMINKPVKATEKATEKLSENQKKIMEILAKNPTVTQNELSEIVGIHRVSISENMRKLQRMGLINRVGGDNGGHWEIVNGF